MRKRLKASMLVLVLLLAVGFAAVSTTLIINGTTNFGTNDSDFDVIFTKSVIDGVDVTDTTISEDGKSLTFTTNELAKVGDKSTLNFVVTNNSTQYDASVTMECKADGANSEYYTITNTMPDVISAKTIANGTVTATLKKVSTEEITETFTCTIEASAVEKTERDIENLEDTNMIDKNIRLIYDEDNDKVADLGDMVAIGSEEFYVISNDGTSMDVLAKYNLNVGYVYTDETTYTELTPTEVKQDATMIGKPADESYPRYGTTTRSNLENYANEYAEYLNNNFNINATSSILTSRIARQLIETYNYQWVYNSSYWLNDDTFANGVGYYITANGIIYTSNAKEDAGVRPVITISTDDKKIDYSDENNNQTVDIGDKVSFGTEEFYIISNDGTNISMLSQYNLNIGYIYTDEITYTTLSPIVIKQDSSMLGKTADESYPRYGTLSGYKAKEYISEYVKHLGGYYNLSLIGTLPPSDILNKVTELENYSWLYDSSYWVGNTFANDLRVYVTKKGTTTVDDDKDTNLAGARPFITMTVEEFNSIKN